MANTQSFDITTGCDLQEVDNAVNQAMKEIRQRYDFKGLDVNVDFQRAENKLVLRAPDEFKLRAMWDVMQEKMVRRHVPLKNLQHGRRFPAAGGTVTQEINLQQGIPIETARAIVKFIKELKIKKSVRNSGGTGAGDLPVSRRSAGGHAQDERAGFRRRTEIRQLPHQLNRY